MKKGFWVGLALLMCLTLVQSAALAETATLAPYADIRYIDIEGFEGYSTQVYHEEEYRGEDIVTFTFNEGTVLEGNEALAAKTLEDGKNPGLGIRALHERGITGKGVNVAIIDQHLLLDHPEFSGKIAAYLDTGCNMPSSTGSMHAPAVTSILVGESVGVAPGARVYYAAVPSWLGTARIVPRRSIGLSRRMRSSPRARRFASSPSRPRRPERVRPTRKTRRCGKRPFGPRRRRGFS